MEEPIAGTLVVARYMDDSFIGMLEEKLLLELDVVPIDPTETSSETDSSVLLTSDGNEIKFLSESSVLGTSLLTDINGEGILSLNVGMSRDIHQHSIMTKDYLALMLLLLGLIFGLIVSLVLERTVLSPISLLNNDLALITKSGLLASRLKVTGDDELSGLSENVNHMLVSLEEKGNILETLDILESSLESIDTGIMVVDKNSRIIMNSKFIDMWGLGVDTLQQNDVTDILEHVVSSSTINEEDPKDIKELQNISSQGKINLYHKNGSIYEWNSGELLHNGDEIGAVYSVNNITDSVKVQQIEQENIQKMQTVLSNIISGVLVIDANTHEIIDSNPVSESMIGLPKEKIIGNICHKFICSAEKGNCPITDKGLACDRAERILIDKSGKKIPILKTVIMANFSGRDVFIESFVDLTTIKEAEQSLIEAKLAAESANRSKSEFLATMSHELRTPLNSIIGFSDLIIGGRVGDTTDMQKKFLMNVSKSGKHLLSLINNILDISKIEAGKMELDLEVFSLDGTMIEVKQLIPPLADKKGLNVEFDIDRNLKQIYADKIKFKQILFNLISNAIKFTPEGGTIDISASIEGDKALFTVKDTGIGIAEENMSKLFQPFVQIDSAINRQYEGTGLGLALVKKFLELHNGNIWADSTLGKGTTFSFELPLEYTNNKNDIENSIEEIGTIQKETVLPMPAILEPENSTGDEPLILVVEDDDASRELLEFTLVSEGYRVASAASGKEALELANRMDPFAITLDIMMPGMDGWDVIKHLKQENGTQDIPIIITSMVDEKKMGIIWGAAEYFIKPVEKEMLLTTLDRLKEKASKHSLKVLVVDDEMVMVDLISEMLKENEFEVLTANGGQKAIDIALKDNPDVIILDLMMPNVSGYDVIHTLKHRVETIDIPIIICSAKDIDMGEKRELKKNVTQIFQKGMLSKESLIECIRNAK
ncbi:response regulator [Methanococcoides sp. SA1]|nr:response regulator [Methanococcoides sp. SA1]